MYGKNVKNIYSFSLMNNADAAKIRNTTPPINVTEIENVKILFLFIYLPLINCVDFGFD